MLGYKYINEQDAVNSQLLCDNYYGYPKTGCDTLHWVSYQLVDSYYVIYYDESLLSILGEPYEI